MSILHAIILGVVEGVTEFLPISSTAHLIITSRILNITQNDFLKTFEIVIQLGAIAAVAVLYFKTLATKPKLIGKILAAFIPTSIIGLAVYSLAKKYLLGNLTITVWALVLGGIAIILFEMYFEEKAERNEQSPKELETAISYPAALWMGVCQVVAIIPGVSRSAATILGGRALGITRKEVVEFSFLLAAPTMLAAAALDIYKNPQAISGANIVPVIIGLVVSFVVAYISMKWLLKYIQTHSFKVFGIYRIIIGLVIWVLFLR
ncbi:MAG: undecaprenyl-diphosphate phosphatase [Candidatus Paceibacterota bacterium]